MPKVTLGEARQVAIALVTALAAAAALGLVPGAWGKVAAILIAALGGATTWPTPPAFPPPAGTAGLMIPGPADSPPRTRTPLPPPPGDGPTTPGSTT
jgi:hypothetical protein